MILQVFITRGLVAHFAEVFILLGLHACELQVQPTPVAQVTSGGAWAGAMFQSHGIR